MGLEHYILLASLSANGYAISQDIQEIVTKSIPSANSEVTIDFTEQHINGVPVFDSLGKMVVVSGKVEAHKTHVPVPEASVPRHKHNYDKKGMRALHDHQEVYRRSVYFEKSQGVFVPATHLQLHNGFIHRTVVVEQDTYEILLLRDEVNYCFDPNHNHTSSHFEYYSDDSPAPGSIYPFDVPQQWQAPEVTPNIIVNQFTDASPDGWLNDVRPLSLNGNNVNGFVQDPVGRFIESDEVGNFEFPFYSREAAATNLFVQANLLHDWLWSYGFTEAEGNYQEINYSGEGVGGDAMTVVAYYDDLFINNAFFTGSGIDGTPGGILMQRFVNSTGERHSAFDNQLVAHEYFHGVTRRLVGAFGGVQPRALNEGWSDFVAYMYTIEEHENLRETLISHSGWLVYDVAESGFFDNYYFGIRSHPISWNMNVSPFTFADTDLTQYFVEPWIPTSPQYNAEGMHRSGQVWVVALWDVFVQLNDVYSYEESRDIMMNLIIEGQKQCVIDPNFNEARDAFIRADEVMYESSHFTPIWTAFARRGMGIDAVSAPDIDSFIGVVEDFTAPNPSDYVFDGVIDIQDIGAFVSDFNLDKPRSDLNWDGVFDNQDLTLFVSGFN